MAISKKAHEILNREDLIAKRDEWFRRLQNVFTSVRDPWNDKYTFGVKGVLGRGQHDPYQEPEKWVEDCLEDLAAQYEAIENETYFRPLCVEYGPYGVHYIDKMLGAKVFQNAGQWYNEYLTTPIGRLQSPDLDTNEVWLGTKRAMQAFVEADVRLPVFGLPTIASALNIAVNLYGQEILMEMLLEPENAQADMETINNLLCEIHRRCRETIPAQQLQPVISWERTQPPGYGQLCGCTTQLISGETYQEIVAPLDDKLLSVYPNGGMIHLCGAHTQHLEAFRNMKSLKALQLNDRAAADLAVFHRELREDQVLYLVPCKEMSVEEAMEITGGKRLVVISNLQEPLLKE